VAGLILIYQSLHTRLNYRYLIGVGFIVIAVLFKQTAAMLVAIPPVAIFVERWQTRLGWKLLLSLGPGVCVILVFVCLYLLAPIHYFYMVEVPRAWPINWEAWLKGMWTLLVQVPCFWCAVAVLLSPGVADDLEWRRRTVWTAAALGASFIVGTLTEAKIGGTLNSLIPFWFSLVTLCWLLLSRVLNCAAIAQSRRQIYLLFFAISLTLTLLPTFQSPLRLFHYYKAEIEESNRAYGEVIARVKELNGVIYSPLDPTILLYAKGQVGRSLYAEHDAIGGKMRIPSAVSSELPRADYFVDTDSYANPIQPEDLKTLHFALFWSNGRYGIWRRDASALERLR
jgi:hypothetical protein